MLCDSVAGWWFEIVVTGNLPQSAGTRPCAASCSLLNYLDAAGHVHKLVYAHGYGWGRNELSAPAAAPDSPLDGYETGFALLFADNEQQHVNYLATIGHVHEPWYSDSNAATSAFTETTWIGNGDPSGATGGGISDHFPLPVGRRLLACQARSTTATPAVACPTWQATPTAIAGRARHQRWTSPALMRASTARVGGTSATAPLYAGEVLVIGCGCRDHDES